MTRYFPSAKGWIAVFLVASTFVLLPAIFPPRVAGGPSPAVPVHVWVAGGSALVFSTFASLFAVARGTRPDKVAGTLMGFFTLWMIIMFIRAAFV